MFVSCKSKAERKIAKVMHEEAKPIKKMKMEDRMRLINRLEKVKAVCKIDAVRSPCVRSQDGQLKVLLMTDYSCGRNILKSC